RADVAASAVDLVTDRALRHRFLKEQLAAPRGVAGLAQRVPLKLSCSGCLTLVGVLAAELGPTLMKEASIARGWKCCDLRIRLAMCDVRSDCHPNGCGADHSAPDARH